MIQVNTILNVSDNSGAKTICCIKVNKGFNRRYAVVGDIITVSIKTLRSKRRVVSNVSKGEVCKALVIRTCGKSKTFFGDQYNFIENSAVLINSQNKFLFTRVFGLVPQYIRYTKYMRLVSLSTGLMH